MSKEVLEIEEACWTVELNIECPKCENYFDYMNTDEYESGGFEGLNHAGSNENIKVECPECGAQLLIKETIY